MNFFILLKRQDESGNRFEDAVHASAWACVDTCFAAKPSSIVERTSAGPFISLKSYPSKRPRSTDMESIGGGILVASSSNALIANVRVVSGQALKGSGIAVIDSQGVSLDMVNITASGMSITSGDALFGGGAHFERVSGLNVKQSIFSNNILVIFFHSVIVA